MNTRPRPTLADYMVIALSPALIMLLVGSLVFFLVELCYVGNYDTRLSFILAMFVMAAVLIARISIEEGRDKAILFAIPLGIVTLIAMIRFVSFQGPLSSLSTPINAGLIGLIWWCADRLTWDSTVIDESKDMSGEGLLQTAGLDDEATTQAADDSQNPPTKSWWQKVVEHRHRPHAPGVWVIYFSIAALPIFGFGHWFVPSGDLERRRYVFQLLVVYVGSALSLLVTTSFLSLRRYLRQRRLEMPLEMAGTWLGVGAAMIVALLLFCLLLPRRNAEYSLTQLPFLAGSPTDLWTTKNGVGNDGPQKPEGDRPPGEGNPSDEPRDKGGKGKKGSDQKSGDQKSGDQKGGDQKSGDQKSGDQKSGDQKSGDQKGGDQKSGDQKSGDQKSGDQKSGDQKSGDQKSGDQKSGDQKSGDQKSGDQKGGDQKGGDQKSGDQKGGDQKSGDKGDGGQEQSEPSEPPPPTQQLDPSKIPQALGGLLGMILKGLYWLVILGIVAVCLWKYGKQIREAIANFLESLRRFWEGLFGGRASTEAEAETVVAAEPPPLGFASFHDPFLSGQVRALPPKEVVRYTFSALEAWARERQIPRGAEQTPHEFAQHVGHYFPGIARETTFLAELYARFAFAPEAATRPNLEPLRQLWQSLART